MKLLTVYSNRMSRIHTCRQMWKIVEHSDVVEELQSNIFTIQQSHVFDMHEDLDTSFLIRAILSTNENASSLYGNKLKHALKYHNVPICCLFNQHYLVLDAKSKASRFGAPILTVYVVLSNGIKVHIDKGGNFYDDDHPLYRALSSSKKKI